MPPDVRKVCDLPKNRIEYLGALPRGAEEGRSPHAFVQLTGRSKTLRTSGGIAAIRQAWPLSD